MENYFQAINPTVQPDLSAPGSFGLLNPNNQGNSVVNSISPTNLINSSDAIDIANSSSFQAFDITNNMSDVTLDVTNKNPFSDDFFSGKSAFDGLPSTLPAQGVDASTQSSATTAFRPLPPLFANTSPSADRRHINVQRGALRASAARLQVATTSNSVIVDDDFQEVDESTMKRKAKKIRPNAVVDEGDNSDDSIQELVQLPAANLLGVGGPSTNLIATDSALADVNANARKRKFTQEMDDYVDAEDQVNNQAPNQINNLILMHTGAYTDDRLRRDSYMDDEEDDDMGYETEVYVNLQSGNDMVSLNHNHVTYQNNNSITNFKQDSNNSSINSLEEKVENLTI